MLSIDASETNWLVFNKQRTNAFKISLFLSLLLCTSLFLLYHVFVFRYLLVVPNICVVCVCFFCLSLCSVFYYFVLLLEIHASHIMTCITRFWWSTRCEFKCGNELLPKISAKSIKNQKFLQPTEIQMGNTTYVFACVDDV